MLPVFWHLLNSRPTIPTFEITRVLGRLVDEKSHAFHTLSRDPALKFTSSLEVPEGDTVNVTGENRTVVALSVTRGATVGVSENATLAISESVASSGGSITTSAGSRVGVTGNLDASETSSIVVGTESSVAVSGNTTVRSNSQVAPTRSWSSSANSSGVRVESGGNLQVTGGLGVA